MAKQEKGAMEVLSNGLLRENPVLILLIGTCPILAVSTSAFNGIGMGLAATFVLIASNFLISLLRNLVSDKVRIPVYITVIAGLVTIIQLLIKAYVPALDKSGDLHPPDHRQLHHPWPGGSLLPIRTGPSSPQWTVLAWAWIHRRPDHHGFHSGNLRQRDVFGKAVPILSENLYNHENGSGGFFVYG